MFGTFSRPGVIFTPGDVFGFSGGLYAGFYKDFSAFGIYGSLLLGHITNRRWRRPKSAT